VRNPIRSEAEAFNFVLVTCAVFGAVALAGWLVNGWAALAVFLAVGLGAWVGIYMRSAPKEREQAVWERRPHPGPKRILVVANETVAGRALRGEILHRARGHRADVLVVCPALNSPLKHWVSDDDGARAAAQERLDASLAALEQDGVAARGEVGDADPLQAIEDGLRAFAADEVIISTHPPGRSNWLERDVVALARDRFDVPIAHVVVDLEHEATAG
jgi:GABA permease